MATLYEKLNTGDDNVAYASSIRYDAQVFTVATATHTVSSVKLLIYRDAGYTTPSTVAIYKVDDSDLPDDDNVLATSDAVAAASIGTGAAGTWIEFTFSTPPTVTLGVKYAIVLIPTAANLRWRYDSDGTAYGGGEFCFRNGTWAADAGDTDAMFEVWGTTDVFVPVDKTYTKELIAIGGNQVWYESTAGTMSVFAAASDNINTTDKLNVAIAFQKMFIANGTNKKVFDFVNTKIVTADVNPGAADGPPDFGAIITGASGASMIVDYITTIDGACTIYGKRTTTITFPASDTITGTNATTSPYYGTAGAISFTMTAVAEVTPPHWYDYTVFGADATNYGAMPDKAYEICRYRGRIQLSGDPNYPHQWYQSRQLNPFDYLYVAGDAQSPVAGNDADCGEVGDTVKVGIPYSDDYQVFGCANELWVMSGDAAYGGELNAIDTTTGILGDRAWCWDDKSNLYLMCTAGLLRIPKGFGQIENLTIELWPDFIVDLAFDSSLHRITLAFNPEDRGIHIFKTTLADGVSSAWWYDLRTEGLFPDSYSAAHGAFSAFYYPAEDPTYRRLLFGCNDGYIRFLDRTAKNDDATKITSYVGFAPLALSTHPREDGIIKNFDLVSGGGASGGTYQTDSSDVTCTVHVARTAEQIIEKLRSGTTAAFTKTFTAPGWSKGNMDRRSVRGQWGGIVLTNDTVDESWSMERLIVDTKKVGRSL